MKIHLIILILSVLLTASSDRSERNPDNDSVDSSQNVISNPGNSNQEKSFNVKVMSFNIAGDSKNWNSRKQACLDLIVMQKPDIIGFQELLPVNLKWALDNFSELDWYGQTIEGNYESFPASVEGESCRIMYNKNRFAVDTSNSGSIWFSNTPDKSSEGWEDLRYCVFARLVDYTTGDAVSLFNTHWSYDSQNSRTNGARLIADAISKRNFPEEPFILTGDFNARISDEGIKYLLQSMTKVITKRVDWIFAKTNTFELVTADTISEVNGIEPSDHDILSAEINFLK